MPIPKARPGGLLPPFLKSPTRRDDVSPYRVTGLELVERYAISSHRIRILEGLLAYRAELRRVGLVTGFQWIDGSFVEVLDREPNDVDVVTVSPMPQSCDPADDHLFRIAEVRKRFLCDGYFVNLDNDDPVWAINESVYWYGLFSHQRRSERWKGILQLELAPRDNDEAAAARLETLKRERHEQGR